MVASISWETCGSDPAWARADRQASHRRNVESPANDRLQLLETPALPECAAVLHRAEERIVEALHGVAAARRRGVCRIGNHSKPEHRGKSRGFPHRRFRYDRLPHSLVLLFASIVVAPGFVDPFGRRSLPERKNSFEALLLVRRRECRPNRPRLSR